MALKPCKECGQEVSTQAKTCPNCGTPNPTQSIGNTSIGCGTGCLGMLVLVVLIGMCNSGGSGPESSNTPTEPPPPRNAPLTVDQTTNVREGPGADYDPVRQIGAGERVWGHRRYEGSWRPLASSGSATDTVGYVLSRLLVSDAPPPKRSGYISLGGSVSFRDGQFIISNGDRFAWSDCELEVNPGVFSGGYSLEARQIAAQSVYSVGAMQFTKNGERFNPFTHKPESFSIFCDTRHGRGSYHGEW